MKSSSLRVKFPTKQENTPSLDFRHFCDWKDRYAAPCWVYKKTKNQTSGSRSFKT